eukprot:601405-Alexandrium_andersonii.AAC.1
MLDAFVDSLAAWAPAIRARHPEAGPQLAEVARVLRSHGDALRQCVSRTRGSDGAVESLVRACLLYTSPSPRD